MRLFSVDLALLGIKTISMKKRIFHWSLLVFVIAFLQNTFAQVNLTNGLVFHLPLDNNTLDVSGNNNHGTGQHLIVSENRFGSKMKAVTFDGAHSNGMISMGAPLMNNLTNWSISYWFRINSNVNAMSLVGQDNSIESGYYTNSNRVIVFHPTFGSFSFPIASPTTWNHVVITGDNSAIRCYHNGNLVRTEFGNYTAVSTTHNFNIGGNVVNQANNNWLRGRIDDVRLYNRVINADEVAALFDANSVTVDITAISETNLCAGESFSVDFSATGQVLPGNEYLLELSDLNGNFVDNIEIGKLQSDALTGTIIGVVPEGAQSGANYLLQVSSTNVMSDGIPNAQLISIQGVVGDIPDPSLFRFVGESNGRLYYRSTVTANFNSANTNCLNNGGHLANIGDQSDQNLLTSYLSGNSAWIGFRRISGTFTWQNNFTSAYLNWHPNQPGTSNHAVMRTDNGRWNGLAPSESRDYFLQLEPAGLHFAECVGADATFSPGELTGATLSWTGPGGFYSNDQNLTIANVGMSNEGTYALTLEKNGCTSNSWEVNLEVNPLSSNKPVGTDNLQICVGSAAEIFVEDTESNLVYSLHVLPSLEMVGTAQNGNNSTLFFTTNPLSGDTDFLIRAEDSNTGCQRWMEDTIFMKTWELPQKPIVVGDEICNGGELELTATGAQPNEVYNWYGNPSLTNLLETNANGQFTTDSIWITQTYFVTITDANGCESDTAQVHAVVIQPLSPEIDLNSGLLVNYTFNGNTQDQSGNNINASIVGNNFSYVDDRKGNASSALNFNGSTYTTSGNPPQVGALTNQVTVAMWVKQTPSNWGATTPLLNKWQMNGLFVALNSFLPAPNQPHQNRVRWRVNNAAVAQSSVNVPFNQWHHIVCTYNGTQLRIFQNGVLTAQVNHSGTITNTITNLEFGRQANGTNNTFYRGDADDVRLYNRALSVNEITALYNDGSVAFSNAPICEGEDLILTAPSFTNADYSWSGPNGFSSTDQLQAAIENTEKAIHEGVYALTVTRDGCTSLPQTVNVEILPTPTITSVINDTICGSGNASLQAVSSDPNATFLWYNQTVGGTAIANQTSDVLNLNNVTQTETRYVSTVLNGCESTRVPVSVIVNNVAATNLVLDGSTQICDGENFTFTIEGAENNVVYTAVVNGLTTTNQQVGQGVDLLFQLPAADLQVGNNTVEISANSPGCGAVMLTQELNLDVQFVPSASISASAGSGDICNGQAILLSASAGDSYLWSTGATSSEITVEQAGAFSVVITHANGCQSESVPFQTQEITLATPVITADGPTTFCDGGQVTLTASGAQNYEWNNNISGLVITVSNSGSFAVSASQASCVTTSAPININVLSLPTVTIQASANEVCDGDAVTLTAQGGNTISWDNNVQNGVAFIPTSTTTYTALVTDNNGCENTASTTVVVNALPTVTIQASANEVCDGDAVTLTAQGGNTNSWDNNVQNGVAFIPTSTTTYTALVTDNNGCENTASTTVAVNALPTVTIQASANEVCHGDAVTLTAQGGVTFIWDNNVQNGVAFIPASTENYNVLVIDNNGCENTGSTSVVVNALPQTSTITGAELVECNADAEVYQVTGDANSTFQWTVPAGATIVNGQGTSVITVNFNSNFGAISVVETNEFGCEGSTMEITVNCNLSVHEKDKDLLLQVYPNPTNGLVTIDGLSEISGDKTIRIYDSAGRLVQEQTSAKYGELVDMNSFASGVYLFNILWKEGQTQFKVVKE